MPAVNRPGRREHKKQQNKIVEKFFKTSNFDNMKQNYLMQYSAMQQSADDGNNQPDNSWRMSDEESPESAEDDICPICGSHLIVEKNVTKCSFGLCKYEKTTLPYSDEDAKQ